MLLTVFALVAKLILVSVGTWTTPRTWVPGELVTASQLNTHLRDNLNALRVLTLVTSTATGTQNNWAPGIDGHSVIFWSGASDLTVTGIAGGVAGQRVTFKNTGSKVAYFAHQSGSSSAGNKFKNMLTSANTPVAPGGYAIFIYDGTDWQLVEHDQGSAIDYAASSTISGWTASPTATITYQVVGKRVFVDYDINGTSNATSASFTVPFTHNTVVATRATVGFAVNGGTVLTTPAAMEMGLAGSNIVTLYKDMAQNAWTNTSSKRVNGQFNYIGS